tara:strand:- start:42 stop:776 length:735 start_codon:yes stop_codon:yes gene_type:complete
MHVTKSKPRKWDDDNIKALKELKAKGLSNKEIAKELDRTEVSIQIKLKRLNKSNTTYNDKHRKDKYRTNTEFLRDLQPTNVLDLYAGENSFYKDYRNPLITNDKNKEFTNCDFNLPALKLLCKMYYDGKKFDLIDLDPFGSAYECFDLSLKLAKKGLIITFGELGHKRWKRLDYVKRYYNINTLDEFNLRNLMKQVDIIAAQNKKTLRPMFVKEWRNIARVYYKIEELKLDPWRDLDKQQTKLF